MWASAKREGLEEWQASMSESEHLPYARLQEWVLRGGWLPDLLLEIFHVFSRVKRTLFLLLLKSASALTVSVSEYYSGRLAQSRRMCLVWCLGRLQSALHLEWSQNWVQRIRRFPWSVVGYRRPSHGAGMFFGELWEGKVKAVKIISKEGQEEACKRTQHYPGERKVTNAHFQRLQV